MLNAQESKQTDVTNKKMYVILSWFGLQTCINQSKVN